MRIVYLIDEMIVGGAQRQIAGLVERLPPSAEAAIACLSRPGTIGNALQEKGITVQAFGCDNFLRPGGLLALWRMRRWLKAFKPDLLHAFLGTACVLAPRLGRRCGAQVITSRRDTGFWMSNAFRRYARRGAREADAVTANSRAVRDATSQLEEIPAADIRVIPNCTDIPAPLLPEDRQRIRRELGFSDNTVIIAHVATFLPIKDHDTALQAALRLSEKTPEARWLFVGDGPERKAAEQTARRLGLEKKTMFLGERADVDRILLASDIGVLTSRSEGFPNAILEAMSAGLPVVSTDCGGVRDLIEDGSYGRLVPAGDAGGLAREIGELTGAPALRQQMGQLARQRVRDQFTWPTVLPQWLALYEHVTGGTLK